MGKGIFIACGMMKTISSDTINGGGKRAWRSAPFEFVQDRYSLVVVELEWRCRRWFVTC